jgi:hypothetical protein
MVALRLFEKETFSGRQSIGGKNGKHCKTRFRIKLSTMVLHYVGEASVATQDWKTKSIHVKPIAKQDNQLYWSAYAECGALLASGLLAIHQHQSPHYYLSRLYQIINYTTALNDPYIKQTCQIAKLKIQTESALQENNYSLAMDYLQKSLILQQQRLSTELTPSLSFLIDEVDNATIQEH